MASTRWTICDITPREGTGEADFRRFMTEEVFGLIPTGPTRAGQVTGQRLLRQETTAGAGGGRYLWVIEWEELGGSVFGSARRPAKADDRLKSADAETSWAEWVLAASS